MLDEWNGIYIRSDGRKVKLSYNESYLLEYLINHKNRIVTGKELTEAVYGKETYHKKSKQIGIFVKRLRHKLAGEIEIIHKYTIGYQIKYIGE